MRDEYNIEELNPRNNPYAGRLKKQITAKIVWQQCGYNY